MLIHFNLKPHLSLFKLLGFSLLLIIGFSQAQNDDQNSCRDVASILSQELQDISPWEFSLTDARGMILGDGYSQDGYLEVNLVGDYQKELLLFFFSAAGNINFEGIPLSQGKTVIGFRASPYRKDNERDIVINALILEDKSILALNECLLPLRNLFKDLKVTIQ
ncbi:MAG: hypothetical protein R2880_13770 [Deinococcales bacterium]